MNKERNELGLKYSILISNFHEWQDRYLYVEIMENFLNDTINFEEFDTKFLALWSSNRNKYKSWEEFIYIINNFKLTKFQGFLSLTSKLFTNIEVREPDPLFRNHYQIYENELKICVKKILLEIKNNYC